jgi:hypothetical protein
MTVAEYIAELQKLPPGTPVFRCRHSRDDVDYEPLAAGDVEVTPASDQRFRRTETGVVIRVRQRWASPCDAEFVSVLLLPS